VALKRPPVCVANEMKLVEDQDGLEAIGAGTVVAAEEGRLLSGTASVQEMDCGHRGRRVIFLDSERTLCLHLHSARANPCLGRPVPL